MSERGLLIIISGPSGAGKGTVVNELVKDETYSLSISATTRKPRPIEVEGKHYFFIEDEQFRQMISDGELLEYAEFCGNFYGTPRKYVDTLVAQGKTVILEIEVVGALQVKKMYPDAVLIFLTPPTIGELKHRLVTRGTEDKERIEMRMGRAQEEFSILYKYDYVVINETVEKAVDDINVIVEAEKMRAVRNLSLIHKIKGDA